MRHLGSILAEDETGKDGNRVGLPASSSFLALRRLCSASDSDAKALDNSATKSTASLVRRTLWMSSKPRGGGSNSTDAGDMAIEQVTD